AIAFDARVFNDNIHVGLAHRPAVCFGTYLSCNRSRPLYTKILPGLLSLHEVEPGRENQADMRQDRLEGLVAVIRKLYFELNLPLCRACCAKLCVTTNLTQQDDRLGYSVSLLVLHFAVNIEFQRQKQENHPADRTEKGNHRSVPTRNHRLPVGRLLPGHDK